MLLVLLVLLAPHTSQPGTATSKPQLAFMMLVQTFQCACLPQTAVLWELRGCQISKRLEESSCLELEVLSEELMQISRIFVEVLGSASL